MHCSEEMELAPSECEVLEAELEDHLKVEEHSPMVVAPVEDSDRLDYPNHQELESHWNADIQSEVLVLLEDRQ